jgi:hypothetical protein
MSTLRTTIADLRTFIWFAELPAGEPVHDVTMKAAERRLAERLVQRDLLHKGRSTNPDLPPGNVYTFDRLLAPPNTLKAFEREIAARKLPYNSRAIGYLRRTG